MARRAVRTCPACGVANQDSASHCDCGAALVAGLAARPPRAASAAPREHERESRDAGDLLVVIGRLLWAGVGGASLFAAFTYWTARASTTDMSAPQVAALAAEALVIAVLPYCLARAWDGLTRRGRD